MKRCRVDRHQRLTFSAFNEELELWERQKQLKVDNFHRTVCGLATWVYSSQTRYAQCTHTPVPVHIIHTGTRHLTRCLTSVHWRCWHSISLTPATVVVVAGVGTPSSVPRKTRQQQTIIRERSLVEKRKTKKVETHRGARATRIWKSNTGNRTW